MVRHTVVSLCGIIMKMVETPKTSMTAHFRDWWWPEKGQTPENKQLYLFSGVVNAGEMLKPWRWAIVLVFGAGGCQRKVETSKTSSHAHFLGWWMLEKGWNPEDEQTCSFSGLVGIREWLKLENEQVWFVFGAGGCQRTFKNLKMSMTILDITNLPCLAGWLP